MYRTFGQIPENLLRCQYLLASLGWTGMQFEFQFVCNCEFIWKQEYWNGLTELNHKVHVNGPLVCSMSFKWYSPKSGHTMNRLQRFFLYINKNKQLWHTDYTTLKIFSEWIKLITSTSVYLQQTYQRKSNRIFTVNICHTIWIVINLLSSNEINLSRNWILHRRWLQTNNFLRINHHRQVLNLSVNEIRVRLI